MLQTGRNVNDALVCRALEHQLFICPLLLERAIHQYIAKNQNLAVLLARKSQSHKIFKGIACVDPDILPQSFGGGCQPYRGFNILRSQRLTAEQSQALNKGVIEKALNLLNRFRCKRCAVEDEDLDVRLSGYPPEVALAIKTEWKEWVQLNPANTFVMQDLKEGWMRYAVPMVAACLKAFEKKERISNYEDSLIDLAARSFVHVKYGDKNQEVLPDVNVLNQVSKLFKSAMTGTALAVTNNWCSAEVIQPKTDDIFEYDKYKGVNSDILSAGGISGIIVSGHAEDGSTFASAQVSMQTAAMRIKQAKDSFCDMMDKINRRLNFRVGNTLKHSANDQIPRFTFPPTDLSGSKAFQDTCLKLWQEGVLSHETLMQSYGLDMNQEVERKKTEEAQGVHAVLAPSDKDNCRETADKAADNGIRGRPTLDEEERHSDPANSQTGRQPKPSNPDGSIEQETQ